MAARATLKMEQRAAKRGTAAEERGAHMVVVAVVEAGVRVDIGIEEAAAREAGKVIAAGVVVEEEEEVAVEFLAAEVIMGIRAVARDNKTRQSTICGRCAMRSSGWAMVTPTHTTTSTLLRSS